MASLDTNLILQINLPQTIPSTPRFKQLSRDQKIPASRKIKYYRMEMKENLQMLGFHDAGKNQTPIAAH